MAAGVAAVANPDHELVARNANYIKHWGQKGWGRCTCPLCAHRVGTADRHYSMGVNRNTGRYHCFRCQGWGYLRGAASALAPERIDDSPEAEDAPYLGPPEDWTPLWEGDGATAAVLRPARDYLARRGVTAQTLAEARIGACLRGRQAGRVVVPVLAVDGETWLGWQARVWAAKLSPKTIKYVTATGMDRYSTLFNEAALAVDTDVPALVVEGQYDALPYWPDVVALLGKPSEGQVEKLLGARRPLVVALDGDAWLEGEMLAMRLAFDGAAASWVKLPPGQDPGSVRPAWLWRAAQAAAAAQ